MINILSKFTSKSESNGTVAPSASAATLGIVMAPTPQRVKLPPKRQNRWQSEKQRQPEKPRSWWDQIGAHTLYLRKTFGNNLCSGQILVRTQAPVTLTTDNMFAVLAMCLPSPEECRLTKGHIRDEAHRQFYGNGHFLERADKLAILEIKMAGVFPPLETEVEETEPVAAPVQETAVVPVLEANRVEAAPASASQAAIVAPVAHRVMPVPMVRICFYPEANVYPGCKWQEMTVDSIQLLPQTEQDIQTIMAFTGLRYALWAPETARRNGGINPALTPQNVLDVAEHQYHELDLA